ncbi:MAG: DNA recombination protein RmuC, partial [Ignavibacteria bacterium]|nr:DNA recombination protein RmuC [Ignavibacteria bacterium]
MEFIYLFTGLAIGVIIGYLIMRLKSRSAGVPQADYDSLQDNCNKLTAVISGAEKEIQILKDNLGKETAELKSEQQKSFGLNSKLAAAETDNINLQKRLEETKSQIEEMQARMKTEFENLANRILEDKSKKFTETNKENIDRILSPLQDKLKSFEEKVNQAYTKDVEDRASLLTQIKTLQELNNRVSEEANNLTRALKGESKTQGNWGELILETVLEKSGLVKDREYFRQESLKNDEGKTQRPDVVVKLPDERYIIIDSKVSLKDYEAYASAEDGNAKAAALKNHIASVRAHIKGLSEKKYHELYDVNSPDFVLMFMPVEP